MKSRLTGATWRRIESINFSASWAVRRPCAQNATDEKSCEEMTLWFFVLCHSKFSFLPVINLAPTALSIELPAYILNGINDHSRSYRHQ